MSLRTPLAEILLELSQLLEAEGVRWYVFGAQAVLAYGRPRLTTDLDVTVEASVEEALGLAEQLEQSGFAPRAADLGPLIRQRRVLPVLHVRTGVPLDIVIAGPGLEAQFLDRARMIDLGGVEVPVIEVADLVATKILAGRPKDLEDVEGILREQEGLDLTGARKVLGLLEEALSRSDLLVELDRIVTRVGKDPSE